jgi:tetratricopeptide (TPR) repeat protein
MERDRRGGRQSGGEGGRRQRNAPPGAEPGLLAALHELEKPLTAGDYEKQKPALARIVELLRARKLRSLDELEFDVRTRLFTALLRAGRQTRAADEAKEGLRREVLSLVGEGWRAAGDEVRAARAFAAAGRTGPAVRILERRGAWEEVAALHRAQGRLRDAARLYEQNGDSKRALECWRESKDARGWLRAALRANDLAEARRAAESMPLPAARDALFGAGAHDIYLDLLASKGLWADIAQLYERAGQPADAAQAWERAKDPVRAAAAWRRAGDPAAATRNVEALVEKALAGGRTVEAGELLRDSGLPERAAELVRDIRPDLAFQWLLESGRNELAVEFATAWARMRQNAGRSADAAVWLERAGELPRAAQAFLEGGEPLEALRLWEELGEWEKAGEAALKAGQKERALEFFRRAGVADPLARMEGGA